MKSELKTQGSLSEKSRTVVAALLPFARRYRGLFALGSIAAIGVVAARLALPWPLRQITDALGGSMPGAHANVMNVVLPMSLLFVACMALLGMCDFLVRLYFARFAIGTTRDMRQQTFVRVLGIDPDDRRAAAGDLVSRLIGDTARLKAGLQGFLVHVATNGLVFAGVTVILFIMDPALGLLFTVAGLATALITVLGARLIFVNSLRHRAKEGELANKIQTSVQGSGSSRRLKRINKASGRYEASQTRIQGQITWLTHIIFGAAVLAALWFSAQAVVAGRADIGDVFVFIMYALMMRGPIVRLARQGTRTGKILGPGYRLVQMLTEPESFGDGRPVVRLNRLNKALKLKGVSVDSVAEKHRLGPLDLTLGAGQRIALYGDDYAVIRTLLEVLAGEREPNAGKLNWDGVRLRGANRKATARQVERVTFATLDLQRAPLEQRFAELAQLFNRRGSIWLFERPLADLDEEQARQFLSVLLSPPAGGRRQPTLVITLDSAVGAECFDRVVHIRAGRVVFDGAPGDWSQRPDRKPTSTHPGPYPRSVTRILFSGYAPVHFRCFKPLYDRLRERPDVEFVLSGGLRNKQDHGYEYDTAAMYAPLGVADTETADVADIAAMDFDVQFSAHTRLIRPRSVAKTIQVFHGISFRNRAVRPENMGCDHYFVVGPYQLSRFVDAALLTERDPRVARIGFMKTDRLLDGTLDLEEWRNRIGFDGRRPVVLYAPTGAKQNSLETMGEQVIRNLAASNTCDLLVKPHDHPKNLEVDWATYLRRYEGEHCRIVPPHEDVVPMMNLADALISDASSVANEFTLLDRPILFLDTPELIARARSVDHSMLDLNTWGRRGGTVVQHPDEVVSAVSEALENPGRHSDMRQAMARKLFYNPGCATDAAIDWLEAHVLSTSDQRSKTGAQR